MFDRILLLSFLATISLSKFEKKTCWSILTLKKSQILKKLEEIKYLKAKYRINKG